MYFYASLLTPLNGEEIFGWRLLLTVPVMTGFLVATGEWKLVRATLDRVRHERRLWLILPLSSVLLAVQLWLFLWAPLHNRALDVSLGYFMLPLTLILAGRLVYQERLSAWQKLAVASALAGVAHALVQVGSLSWASALVALGYPVYFVLRRQMRLDHLGGLWFDMVLALPVALWFVAAGGGTTVLRQHPWLYLLIPVLGIISAAALAFYMLSSRHLALGLFGLLGYVEPVLLVGVSLLLGERIGAHEWLTYGPIWLAVALLVAEGTLRLRTAPRSAA
jgi:chloramphenicol-sensitive protein RarD